MTIDKSLKTRSTSVRVRNVLTRDERIARLKEADRWTEGTSTPTGLPKVRVYKLALKKKKKKKEEGEEGATDKKKAAKKK